jgi:uncharacterized GH25 family protein
MKVGVVVGLSLLFVAAPVVAHDFWIQPERFQVRPNAPVPVTFQIGHGDARERYANNDRIMLLGDFFNGRRRDRRSELRSTGPADLVTRFAEPGLHVLGLQTSYAFSALPAGRFNDYAKEEGLVTIIAARQREEKMTRPGRERYSRRAKALILVGTPNGRNQLLATRPIGLKLEIVPDRNPYALGPSRQLPLHVLYNGRRLPNATVKLTSLEADERPVATAVTDTSGRASFRVPAKGSWLVNVVWAEPVKGDPKVDFETTFSSLTFGYGSGGGPR